MFGAGKHFIIRTGVSLLLTASFFLVSCATQEKDPAKRVLLESVKSTGGMSRSTGWTSLVQKGTLTSVWPGWGTLKADAEYYTVKPDKQLLDQDYSAHDHPFYFVYTYNAGQAWSEVNMGIRQNDRTTSMLEKRMREIDGLAYFVTACDTFYIDSTATDDSLFTVSQFTRIGCVQNGDTILFDIASDTRYPLRKIERSQAGETHTIMSDYRKSGALTVPYRVTVYQNGSMTSDFDWEEIVYDVEVDPALFEKNRPEQDGS